jgi:hypothetical protein
MPKHANVLFVMRRLWDTYPEVGDFTYQMQDE